MTLQTEGSEHFGCGCNKATQPWHGRLMVVILIWNLHRRGECRTSSYHLVFLDIDAPVPEILPGLLPA